MTDRSTAAPDMRIAAIFRDGPTSASSELLARTLSTTRRMPQRPGVLAIVRRGPALAPWTWAPGFRVRVLVVAALVLALVAIALAIGRSLEDRRSVVPSPIPTPAESLTQAASPAPTAAVPKGTIVRIPGGTATFAVVLQGTWRIGPDNELKGDSVRIVIATTLTQSWDVAEVAWIIVRATPEPLEQVQASMVADGWQASGTPIDAGLDGVVLLPEPGRSLDPTALVRGQGVTYRIASHHTTPGPHAESNLQAFLRNFTPIGTQPAGRTYRDPAAGFAVLYDATPVGFLPGVELGDGVTRFLDSSCGSATVEACDEYVDVVRRPNVSPLEVVVPDAGEVHLAIDPDASDYVTLAEAWDAEVGTSLGSSTDMFEGVLTYYVQNEGPCELVRERTFCAEVDARFIHRGAQWLIVVAPVREGDHYNRLRAFLAGFSLIPPG